MNGKALWLRLTHGKGGKYSTHKYNLQTSNCDKRRVQMQAIGNTLEIKRSMTQNNHFYIQTLVSKLYGNCTLKIYKDTHTQKRKSNPNTTVKLVIKSQNRAREEGKKKDLQKQIQTINKMAIRICILIIQIINLTINGLNAPTKRLSS